MSVVFVRCREVLARVDAGAAVARERVGALARREEAVAVVRAEGEHVQPRRLAADRLGTGPPSPFVATKLKIPCERCRFAYTDEAFVLSPLP